MSVALKYFGIGTLAYGLLYAAVALLSPTSDLEDFVPALPEVDKNSISRKIERIDSYYIWIVEFDFPIQEQEFIEYAKSIELEQFPSPLDWMFRNNGNIALEQKGKDRRITNFQASWKDGKATCEVMVQSEGKGEIFEVELPDLILFEEMGKLTFIGYMVVLLVIFTFFKFIKLVTHNSLEERDRWVR